MARRKLAAIAILIAVGSAVGFWFFHKPSPSRHIFINETADHRFDESIRVSILAASNRTGIQNAVVISNRENEADLAKAAAEIFSELQLGRSNHGRAILYYFNPKSRSLKIEIGHALEGVLPDLIVQNLELAAKSFIFVDKYQDFWAELINTINIEVQKKQRGSGGENWDYDFSKFRFLSGGGGILSTSYQDSWQQLLKESRRSGAPGLELFRAQKDVKSTVSLYLKSLEEGFGDMELDILAKESQFFRKLTPQSSYQMFRNARMYQEAGIDRIFTEENLAFVFFKPEHPVLPLILKKAEGYWRVQEPLSWSLFQRYENSNQIFLKFPIQGFSREALSYLNAHIGAPLFPLGSPLSLQFLSQNASGDSKSSLIHLYWLDKVEYEFEKAGLAALSNDELMMAADVHQNLGHFSKFRAAYDSLAERLPRDKRIQSNKAFYHQALAFKDEEWILSRP